jgi:hypothetical protein
MPGLVPGIHVFYSHSSLLGLKCRHCEAHRAEAIQKASKEGWIASLRSQ